MMRLHAVIFAVCAAVALAWPGMAQVSVSIVQTAADTTDRLTPKETMFFGDDFDSPNTIAVNAGETFQTIFGFGGALTEAASINIMSLTEELQEEVMQAYYGPNGHGYTVGRVPLNSCDFSPKSYNFDNVTNDFSLSQFDTNVTHDTETMIPVIRHALQTAKAAGNQLRLFTTPWSPPPWMKGNDEMTGSSVPGLLQNPTVFESWALYISKFITAYATYGINFWGLTVQNEPAFAAPWEACVYSAANERDFIKNYLGPRLEKDHPNLTLMIWDHNKDDIVEWANTILSDPEAAQYVDGIAFHWYSGDQFQNLAATHALFPNTFMLATEACNCPGVMLDYWPRGETYGHDIIGDLNNWAVGWNDWNIVLNAQGLPNHLNNSCDAPIIALNSTAIHYQPPYFYMGHFSRFLPPGSVRIQSQLTTTQNATLEFTSFRDPGGNTVVIVMNESDDAYTFKLTDISLPGQAFKYTSLAHSIVTFTYSAG